tara:strand:- start:1321 stop:2064 length:744 start_codon:yes stop_codon:yes gene_type:complete
MENVGKTIVSVFRKEWAGDEEQLPTISEQAIRNERSKVNKQFKDQDLDWKYVYGLVQFAMTTFDHATIVKRLGDMRQKYRDCKKELTEYQETFNIKLQEELDLLIKKEYDEKLKEKVEYERNLELEELQQRVKVQSKMIQSMMKKNEINFNRAEELQQRPTKESYEKLQKKFDDYIDVIQLKRSESSSSLSSDDDSKIKKKYKKLKAKCDKLELENFKLKQKINNKDDSDSDSDCSSSDDDVITEQI